MTQLAAALRHRPWLPVLGLLSGLLGTLVLVAASSPTWSTTVTFAATAAPPADGGSVFGSNDYVEQRLETYAAVLSGPGFRGLLRQRAGAPVSVSVAVVGGSSLLTATVSGPSAAGVQAGSQVLLRLVPPRVAQVETGATRADVALATTPVRVDLVDPPAPPSSSGTSAALALRVLLGGLVGAALGLAVAVLADRLGPRLTSATDLQDLPGAYGGVALAGSAAGYVRELPGLVDRLLVLAPQGDPVLVVAADDAAAAGAARWMVDLAAEAARTGRRWVLVSADPADLDPESGLELRDLLSSAGDVDRAVLDLPPAARDHLLGPAGDVLMEELQDRGDLLLLHCGPMDVTLDAVLLAPRASAAVLVARRGAPRTPVADAVTQLRLAGLQRVLVVLGEPPSGVVRPGQPEGAPADPAVVL